MYENIALGLAFALLFPGIFMALVPMLPALTYMFVIALLAGVITGFGAITGQEVLILLAIALLSILIDHLSGLLGAKWGGAHTKSLLWGFFGGVMGTLAMPVVGSFIGLFLGVLISEVYYKKHSDKALRAAGSALIGSLTGVAANVILAVLFTILFFFFAF